MRHEEQREQEQERLPGDRHAVDAGKKTRRRPRRRVRPRADILEIVENTDVNSLGEPLVTPQGAIAIMVCERRVSDSSIPTRDQIENRLIDQQVAQASKRHLRDLRRQASIVIR